MIDILLSPYSQVVLYLFMPLLCWRELRRYSKELDIPYQYIWVFCFMPTLNVFVLLAISLYELDTHNTKLFKHFTRVMDIISFTRFTK